MKEKNQVSLCEFLKFLRLAHKFTQSYIASILNISRSTYSYYESGKTEPNLVSLGILSKLYNENLENFIFDENRQLRFQDSKNRLQVSLPTNMASLTAEERELVAQYRLVKSSTKRKVRNNLEKEVISSKILDDIEK